MLKADRALHGRRFAAVFAADAALVVQYLHTACQTGLCAGKTRQNHIKHHDGEQNIIQIGNIRQQRSGKKRTAAHEMAAEPVQSNGGKIENDCAAGMHQSDANTGADGGVGKGVVRTPEFFFFVVGTHKGFYHTDGDHILLNTGIQCVGPSAHCAEKRLCNTHDNKKCGKKRRDRQPIHDGETGVQSNADHHGYDQQRRCAH